MGFFGSLSCKKHCIYPGKTRKLKFYCRKTSKNNQSDMAMMTRRILFCICFCRGASGLDDLEWLHGQWLNPVRGVERWLKPALKILSLLWVHPASFCFWEFATKNLNLKWLLLIIKLTRERESQNAQLVVIVWRYF